MLIDSHCHLDFPELKSDLPGIISRAQMAGVGLMHTICTRISKVHEILELAEKYDRIFCSIGNHPLNLKDENLVSALDILELSKKHLKIISIGETGLDYYYGEESKEKQKESFIQHINASQASGLPVVIHTRSADRDTVAILQQQLSIKHFPAVIHCFTASEWLADACIEMGFYISASGIITFKNAYDIQRIFKKLPLNKILIETDSPFLAPVPKRGKANEPSYVKYIADFLAQLRDEEANTIYNATTKNFFNLFTKAPGSDYV